MNSSLIFTWLLTLFLACPVFTQMGDSVPPAEPVQEGSSMNDGELTIKGVVIENVHDCAFDGNCYVIVETADGSQFNVIYTLGMLGCANTNLDNTIWDFAAGTNVEAYGEILEDGSISVCGSDAYYLNKLDQ